MVKEQSHNWETAEIKDLFETILSLETLDEAERFLRDLCTLAELEAMAHRWQGGKLADPGGPDPRGGRRGRGGGGRRRAGAEGMATAGGGGLTPAPPARRRPREPAVHLLEDAGL